MRTLIVSLAERFGHVFAEGEPNRDFKDALMTLFVVALALVVLFTAMGAFHYLLDPLANKPWS